MTFIKYLIIAANLALIFLPFNVLAINITDIEDCTDLEDFIWELATPIQAVIGAIAVIMILVAAFKYLTAGEDAQRVKSAHATITWAIVGVVVALFATGAIFVITSILGEIPDC